MTRLNVRFDLTLNNEFLTLNMSSLTLALSSLTRLWVLWLWLTQLTFDSFGLRLLTIDSLNFDSFGLQLLTSLSRLDLSPTLTNYSFGPNSRLITNSFGSNYWLMTRLLTLTLTFLCFTLTRFLTSDDRLLDVSWLNVVEYLWLSTTL